MLRFATLSFVALAILAACAGSSGSLLVVENPTPTSLVSTPTETLLPGSTPTAFAVGKDQMTATVMPQAESTEIAITALPTEPAPETSFIAGEEVTIEGVVVTIPKVLRVEIPLLDDLVGEIAAQQILDRIAVVFPQRAPKSIQLLFLLERDDSPYVVVGLDTDIDRWLSVKVVEGFTVDPISDLLPEFGWSGGLIISDRISPAAPEIASSREVLSDPRRLALRRVQMTTTYAFGGVRFKESEILGHIGLGFATDGLGSIDESEYLGVFDPYNTETQIRDANIFGTVLFPSDGVLRLLTGVLGIDSADVDAAMSNIKPAFFYETIKDDEAELRTIGELVPTLLDPTPKLPTWHGRSVTIEGIALGGLVRSEDLPYLDKSPVGITGKVEGVVDLTGAMVLGRLSSIDGGDSGVEVGHYRYELSIHSFDDGKAVAFVIDREVVPLDPIGQVERARLGSRVQTELSDYEVLELPEVFVTQDLILGEIDLLIPISPDASRPPILTKRHDLESGDYLTKVSVDGYLVDDGLLMLTEHLPISGGPGVLVVGGNNIEFMKGPAPVTATPTLAPDALPPPTPTSLFPSPTAEQNPSLPPTPTATASPTPTQVPTPTATPVPLNADFIAEPVLGTAPLTVQFTDTSLGEPTSWLWSFGNGFTSTEEALSHTYIVQGTYTVSLTIASGDRVDTEPKIAFIKVEFKGQPMTR